MPGVSSAGARSDPRDDVTSSTSPWPICIFAAVCGLISIQLLHIADVIGSGISWSHGRCDTVPSLKVCDANGRKWNGYVAASPSKDGGVNGIAAPPAATRPAASGG